MSFILVPNKGQDIRVNGWNWRPTLLLISPLLNQETYQRMSCQGCSGTADDELCKKIADLVDSKLKDMTPGDRLLPDLAVTAKSWDDLVAADELYSASYDWLQEFSEFCKRSGGFVVM